MKKKNNIFQKLAFPPFYFFASIVIMILCYFIFLTFNLDFFPFNLTGLVFLLFGVFLIIRYTIVFNRENTTLQNEKPSSFVKKGFYRYSRNPMYLGGLIFLFGLAIILANIISFIMPVFFFLIMNFLCIPVEESIMNDTFKDEYKEYKNKVRRWL